MAPSSSLASLGAWHPQCLWHHCRGHRWVRWSGLLALCKPMGTSSVHARVAWQLLSGVAPMSPKMRLNLLVLALCGSSILIAFGLIGRLASSPSLASLSWASVVAFLASSSSLASLGAWHPHCLWHHCRGHRWLRFWHPLRLWPHWVASALSLASLSSASVVAVAWNPQQKPLGRFASVRIHPPCQSDFMAGRAV